jgi:DNA-binding MarR family transcriptional regulator
VEISGSFLITKVKQIQDRVFEQLLDRQGIDQLNSAQGRILNILWNEDGIPISDLAKKTGLANTSLTGMLERLDKSGYLERIPDPADRRRTVIRLTDKALSMKEQYQRVSDQLSAFFYKGFSYKEIVQFEKNLERILENLTEGAVEEETVE